MTGKKSKRYENLKRRMYLTRYCRINAFKRTKSWDRFFQAVLFFSNLFLLVSSILTLLLKIDWLNVFIVLFSVTSFSLGLFVSTKNYAQQSSEYKRTYNEIEKLESDLVIHPDKIDEIESSYNQVISFSLNHDEQDSYRLRYEYYYDPYINNEPKPSLSGYKQCRNRYFRSLSKDITIKILLSLGVYLLFNILYFFIKFCLTLFEKCRYEKK